MYTVDIGIPTYRRPEELQRLLASLDALDLPQRAEVRIVVVDNDAKGSAREGVERTARGMRLPVRYVVEPAAGVVNARNRLLESSDADYLAMIDDDELATPSWLDALLLTAERHGSDAVFGRVQLQFPDGAPAWLQLMHRPRIIEDQSPVNLGSTSNVLLRRQRIATLGLRFDPAFNYTGGEDTDFFARLGEAGGRCHYSTAALLIEPIHPSRIKLGWYVMRNFRVGQTNAAVFGRRMPSGRHVVGSLVRGVVAPALLLAGACLFLARRRPQGANLFLTGIRNFGYATALTGRRAEEYRPSKADGLTRSMNT